MYLAFVEVVSGHFDRLGYLLYTTGTMCLAASYLCAVIVGMVLLRSREGRKQR